MTISQRQIDARIFWLPLLMSGPSAAGGDAPSVEPDNDADPMRLEIEQAYQHHKRARSVLADAPGFSEADRADMLAESDANWKQWVWNRTMLSGASLSINDTIHPNDSASQCPSALDEASTLLVPGMRPVQQPTVYASGGADPKGAGIIEICH